MPRHSAEYHELPQRVFISHAYADQEALRGLLDRLPPGVEPVIHPPDPANPDRAVSNGIVAKVSACPGLIYLQGGASARSEWVAFEKDYAWRTGRQVFAFNPDSARLVRHEEVLEPLTCIVVATASAEARQRVSALLQWMERERHFRLDASVMPARIKEIPVFVGEALEEGSPIVWFVDDRVAAVANLAMDDDFDLELLEGMGADHRRANDYAGYAGWLDDHSVYARIAPEWVPPHPADPDKVVFLQQTSPIARAFGTGRAVDLVAEGRDFDWNRADDLIVRLTVMARRLRPFFADLEA